MTTKIIGNGTGNLELQVALFGPGPCVPGLWIEADDGRNQSTFVCLQTSEVGELIRFLLDNFTGPAQ